MGFLRPDAKARKIEEIIYNIAQNKNNWNLIIKREVISEIYSKVSSGEIKFNSDIYYSPEVSPQKVMTKLNKMIWLAINRNEKLRRFLNDLSKKH
jgi:hypothetical protein